ncbi:hypothetical protein BH11ACT8_BH11ACT8_00560 [soil metagenome]
MRGLKVALLGLAAVVLIIAGVRTVSDGGYEVEVVLPAATNLVKGSEVEINGASAGEVKDLEVRDGKAVVTVSLNDDYAPITDGTTAIVSYKALLGERILELQPGDSDVEIADGGLIEGTVDRVELDQVLAALDAPTRAKLTHLLAETSDGLAGREADTKATIKSLGPAAEALGEVLDAVGTDGPALRQLVTRLSAVTTTLARRQDETSGSIEDLTTAMGTIGRNRAQLDAALTELPGTLDVARTALDKVPETVTAASPLLHDLQPGVALLPGVSRRLEPVLSDLRPTIAELRPTMTSLRQLLQYTPALLDGASTFLPQADQVLSDIGPALGYLRPYTPELAGWLSNWGSGAANYDSNGHYLRAFVQEGTTSTTINPGVLPPGIQRVLERHPGESEGQPWTDANGSEMQ